MLPQWKEVASIVVVSIVVVIGLGGGGPRAAEEWLRIAITMAMAMITNAQQREAGTVNWRCPPLLLSLALPPPLLAEEGGKSRCEQAKQPILEVGIGGQGRGFASGNGPVNDTPTFPPPRRPPQSLDWGRAQGLSLGRGSGAWVRARA